MGWALPKFLLGGIKIGYFVYSQSDCVLLELELFLHTYLDQCKWTRGVIYIPFYFSKYRKVLEWIFSSRHGLYQQEPTQHNTTAEICWLLCTQQPTFVQLVVVYPTTNIHNFISWCCVPNTNNCWVVLCTQLFSKNDTAWEKNHFCLKGFSLVQKISLLWLFLNFWNKFNK